MALGIFSTYRAGENRVTSSLLAVIRSLSIDRMQRIVGAMLGDETELIEFSNQPGKGKPGVPDATIAGSFRILFETKTERKFDQDAFERQLERHLDRLDGKTGKEYLVALTPNSEPPAAVNVLTKEGQVGAGRLIWASFAQLSDAFDELFVDPQEVIGEREAFLIRELQAMFDADGLLGEPEDVLVVAARRAWPFYERYGFYTCQANRSFRPVGHLAFYAGGEIKQQIAQIVYPDPPEAYEAVDIAAATDDESDPWLFKKLQQFKAAEPEKWAKFGVAKVVRLTPSTESPESDSESGTIDLGRAIANDKTSHSGRSTAFTMGHRYVRLNRLTDPNVTTTLQLIAKE